MNPKYNQPSQNNATRVEINIHDIFANIEVPFHTSPQHKK